MLGFPTGGYLINRVISAATDNATLVKGAQGQLMGIQACNTNAAARYLKIYNKATAPTVGTDTPALTITLPPSVPVNIEFSRGVNFGTGIGLGIVTGAADSSTTAVAANEIIVNVFYL